MCHQSIHFVLSIIGCEIIYFYPEHVCSSSGRYAIDVDNQLKNIKTSCDANYDMVILNGSTYDGCIINAGQLIIRMLDAGIKSRVFFVDEAWGALGYFNKYKELMAGNIIKHTYGDISLISTISIHKTLFSLRQSSAINVYSNDKTISEKIKKTRYMLHTTSPNNQILSSIDLGINLFDKCKDDILYKNEEAKSLFYDYISNHPSLDIDISEDFIGDLVHLDDSRISLKLPTNINPELLKKQLLDDYGIYLSRTTNDSILINIHIGISKDNILKLINALEEIMQNGLKESFSINYPPGIPLQIPSENNNFMAENRFGSIYNSNIIHI